MMKALACLAALLALPAAATNIVVPPGEPAPAFPMQGVQEDAGNVGLADSELPAPHYSSLMEVGTVAAEDYSVIASEGARPMAATVAEPGLVLLLATGLGALAWVRRRRPA
jgi:hypothetical protein